MRFLSALILVGLTFDAGGALAFNIETHAAMNDTAALRWDDNDFLQVELGFSEGVNRQFHGRSALSWFREGGAREDDIGLVPLQARPFRHFHDPLRQWDEAGIGPFSSSVVWMQDEGQSWSWLSARNHYYTALTASNPNLREQAWADTFRALGQIMHLVEDAAQPGHVRNDAHGLEFACHAVWDDGCVGNFEYWVSRHPSEYSFTGEASFARGILYEATGHSEAPIPIAHLIDTDYYDGTDPEVTTGGAIGIAEFVNANFFSEDSISTGGYDFPDVDSLLPSTAMAGGDPKRVYYKKAIGEGIQVDPVARGTVLDHTLVSLGLPRLLSTDEAVWRKTAQMVVPRATDYAQGVLEYFFRGKFAVEPDLEDSTRLVVTNLSPEDVNGTFTLYYDDGGGNRQPVPGAVSEPVQIATGEHLSISAFGPTFIPPPDSNYTLVFKGTMGGETPTDVGLGAVAGKVVNGGASFLLVEDTVAHRSDFLDVNWQRVPLGAPVVSGGTYVKPDLLFLGPSQRSEDGGRTVRDFSSDLESIVGANVYVTSTTYLGGSDILVTFWKPSCDWDYQAEHYACPPTGVAHSNDLGGTWALLSSPGDLGLWRIDYIGDGALLGECTSLSSLSDVNTPQYVWCKSTDFGLTWSPTVLTIDEVQTEPFMIDEFRMVTDPGMLFIASSGCGRLLAWNQREGTDRVLLTAATFSPAATSANIGLYRSTDGVNWQRVFTNPTDAAGIAPNGSALASYLVDVFGNHGLKKSTDSGETWESADPPMGFQGFGCMSIIPLRNDIVE